MATFPLLKTGAVMQYPGERASQFRSQVVRFVDGSEQRYRDAPAVRRWKIRLELLEERELAAIEEFFAENQGAFGSFTFVDPWDGTAYADCSLESDEIVLRLEGEARGMTEFGITENRN